MASLFKGFDAFVWLLISGVIVIGIRCSFSELFFGKRCLSLYSLWRIVWMTFSLKVCSLLNQKFWWSMFVTILWCQLSIFPRLAFQAALNWIQWISLFCKCKTVAVKGCFLDFPYKETQLFVVTNYACFQVCNLTRATWARPLANWRGFEQQVIWCRFKALKHHNRW